MSFASQGALSGGFFFVVKDMIDKIMYITNKIFHDYRLSYFK
jgi:hypothetical protein